MTCDACAVVDWIFVALIVVLALTPVVLFGSLILDWLELLEPLRIAIRNMILKGGEE